MSVTKGRVTPSKDFQKHRSQRQHSSLSQEISTRSSVHLWVETISILLKLNKPQKTLLDYLTVYCNKAQNKGVFSELMERLCVRQSQFDILDYTVVFWYFYYILEIRSL